jgi:hypothetical protein
LHAGRDIRLAEEAAIGAIEVRGAASAAGGSPLVDGMPAHVGSHGKFAVPAE